jgi:hypothetical protein
VRAMSLVFRFEVAIDDRKIDCTNRPGDALRLRASLGGADVLDQRLAAGGLEAYETMFRFAWMALRHHDDYHDLEWDDFIDRCEAWAVGDDEDGAVRPTDAGRSNAP